MITEPRLRDDLVALGVAPGDLLTVHSSLSSLGWVEGGAPTVVHALLETLGDEGTLAMPAATPQCAAPPGADAAPPGLPVFDRATTPTRMGAIAEAFRTWPGTVRSAHPLESVCARGPQADAIVADHPLPFSEGPGTPFGRLADLGSGVLLLGVGFNRCTALHLAETRAARRRTTSVRFAVVHDGCRKLVETPNVADDHDTLFPAIGRDYLAAGRARRGRVGEAEALLFPMPDLVGFAVAWLDRAL